MTGPRVGLIGARRVRQGLGPFVAGFLVDAGASVPCFLGTSTESCGAARRALHADHGIDASGYTDVAAMLDVEALDALVICSPHTTHERYLHAAVESGLHVLCEKPLLWGDTDIGAAGRRIVERFAQQGLILRESCQWPYTLAAYRDLYPDVSERVERFEMRLSPTTIGPNLLPDVMSHPLSLLQTLIPGEDPRIERASCAPGANQERERGIRFDYRVSEASVLVEVHLVAAEARPRVAAYAVNGQWAHRVVQMPEYALFFTDGVRRVGLPDPMERLVHDFVRAIRQGPDHNESIRLRDIRQRVEMLHSLRRLLADRPA